MARKKPEPYPQTVMALLSEKSAVLLKAHTFAEMGLAEAAGPLWTIAAGYEERIAPLLEGLGQELEAAVHRISAGSCYQKAGDLSRAANLYRAALAGPLLDVTRREVSRFLADCLKQLTRSVLGPPPQRKVRKVASES